MKRARSLFLLLGTFASAACGQESTELPKPGQEVAVTARDGVRLGASLLLPSGDPPFPAVVGLVGSGAYSHRDAWIPGHWPFWRDLSEELLSQGIAVLLFDKRGVQASEGNWKTRTLQQRADDALAAVADLAERPEIDAQRIGLVGQSQGGWVAQIAAAHASERVAFLMTFAGPAIPVLEQVADDRVSELRCEGKDEVSISRRRERYVARLSRFARGHLSVIRTYDPAHDLASIQVPFLAVFAENDELVWAEKNAARLRESLAEGASERLFVHVVEGANHAFLYGDRCRPLRGHDGPPAFRDALLDADFFAAAGLSLRAQRN